MCAAYVVTTFRQHVQKNIPAQLPEEALQRSCVNFVDDLLHLLNTAECASDTVLLECVKAGWALLQLMPMLGAINARHEALLHFAKACLAAYVCRGRPAFVNRAREDHIPVPPPPPVEDGALPCVFVVHAVFCPVGDACPVATQKALVHVSLVIP